MKKLLWTRKQRIREFAEELAYLQMKADKWLYVLHDQEMSGNILGHVGSLKGWLIELGICNEVYTEAYKIYDFRNSGKKDFVPDIKRLQEVY
jgi:hypothetical protein